MPWTPIDRLPEEAKDGRKVDLWSDGRRYPQCKWNDEVKCWGCDTPMWSRPTHFYLFENGRTMPDAPEGE